MNLHPGLLCHRIPYPWESVDMGIQPVGTSFPGEPLLQQAPLLGAHSFNPLSEAG